MFRGSDGILRIKSVQLCERQVLYLSLLLLKSLFSWPFIVSDLIKWGAREGKNLEKKELPSPWLAHFHYTGESQAQVRNGKVCSETKQHRRSISPTPPHRHGAVMKPTYSALHTWNGLNDHTSKGARDSGSNEGVPTAKGKTVLPSAQTFLGHWFPLQKRNSGGSTIVK